MNDIGLGAVSDRRIWTYAVRNGAVLVTKDGDFADLALRRAARTSVVWVRLGNTTNKALWRTLEPLLPEILEALEQRGERLVEIL